MGIGSINFSGLSSGIDTNSIIQQLLAVDRQPEQLLQNNIARLQQRQSAYTGLSAQLLGLQSAARSLNALRAFDLVTASSTDETVATISAQTGAQTGQHTLVVNALAKAQKISSAAQSSQTAPLGYAGQIVINGKAINVQASDSLQTLANNINAAQPGVSASIISPSAGKYYLTLGSTNSGVQGQISLSDTSGGALLANTLGFFTDSTSLFHPLGPTASPTGAASNYFKDSATSIGTLEGQTAPVSGTIGITVGGATPTDLSVSIDLGADSLSTIASKINAARDAAGLSSATFSAQVVTSQDPISGETRPQLLINGATSFTDQNNVLTNLGILQRTIGTDPTTGNSLVLQAAQDARFTLDGLSATRSTNSFSDAISGVTINLLKESTGTTTASTSLSVFADTTTIKSNIQGFVKAFNDTVDLVSQLAQFDSSTGKTGPLFGDTTTSGIIDNLTAVSTSTINGLPINLSLLSQIGITLDQGNHLQLDTGKLDAALSSNLQGVAKLFRAYGTTTDPAVQFVSSTKDTRPSGPNGYTVTVLTPASQATIVGGAPLPDQLGQDETLSFGGPLFGTGTNPPLSGRQITLRAGSSPADVVSQINGDPILGNVLSASIDPTTNALKLVSKAYGSSAEFAVVSSINSNTTANTSGVNVKVLDAKGVDVVGSINGEVATGVGQFLTGSQQGTNGGPNGSTLGLQLRITATAPGTYGTIAFTSGAADLVQNYITTQTDVYTGNLTTAVNGLQDNINDIQNNINDIEARIKSTEEILRAQFTAMETAIAQIKSGAAGLAQLGASSFISSSVRTG